MKPTPLAFLITFSCYGARLHGNHEGSVDRKHNEYGAPKNLPDASWEIAERRDMQSPPYFLDARRRWLVLESIRAVCEHRGWPLLAAHVRTNHVHVVVQAHGRPEQAMNTFKAYATRRINAERLDPENCRRWARHGSTHHLFTAQRVKAAVRYVIHGQGERMSVFEAPVS